MENFNSVNEILDFAIEREQEAVDFYIDLAEKSIEAEMKNVFIQFSREEMGHKARLINIKENGLMKLPDINVQDLQIADYIVDIIPRAEMTYQEALVMAMKREKIAFKLYQKLASKSPTESIKSVFLSLAMEEAKHKLRFEIEYDENVLKEN